MVFELSSSRSNSPAPPVQSRPRTTYLNTIRNGPGVARAIRNAEKRKRCCGPPPARAFGFGSIGGVSGCVELGVLLVCEAAVVEAIGLVEKVRHDRCEAGRCPARCTMSNPREHQVR